MLSLLYKFVDNLVVVIGENYSTNKMMERLLDKGSVSCHSHRFNLTVPNMTVSDSEMIDEVRKLMQRLSNPIPVAKQKAHTKLQETINKVTHWSFTSRIPKYLLELREGLSKIEDEDEENLILTVTQYRRIERFSEEFDDLKLCVSSSSQGRHKFS